MAGKTCDGSANAAGSANPHPTDVKAFCEGRYARTLATSPTNPHPSGSAEYAAFARGVASKAAGDPDGCCGPTGAAAT